MGLLGLKIGKGATTACRDKAPGNPSPGAKGPSIFRHQRDVELFRFIGPASQPISETGRGCHWYLNI